MQVDRYKTTLPPLWWPLVTCDDSVLHRKGERGTKCAICGMPQPLNEHHIVPKSRGRIFLVDGTELELPTITLCGFGNHMPWHHGMAHAGLLHFRVWKGKLQFLPLDEPASYIDALVMEGWEDI